MVPEAPTTPTPIYDEYHSTLANWNKKPKKVIKAALEFSPDTVVQDIVTATVALSPDTPLVQDIGDSPHAELSSESMKLISFHSQES